MNHTLIIEKAIEEIVAKRFGMTEQFLEIHSIAYANNKPVIARVDTTQKDEAIVYFNVEDEEFYLAVYLNTEPGVSVRWVQDAPFHSVYFVASSDKLSFEALSKFSTLTYTRGRNKGDLRNPRTGSGVLWKESAIVFDPYPGADEFENKLNMLLDYLEQDKEGIKKFANNTEAGIQVYSCFHNGNTMIGGHHLEKDHIHRISRLNLEIDFDIRADGNFFRE